MLHTSTALKTMCALLGGGEEAVGRTGHGWYFYYFPAKETVVLKVWRKPLSFLVGHPCAYILTTSTTLVLLLRLERILKGHLKSLLSYRCQRNSWWLRQGWPSNISTTLSHSLGTHSHASVNLSDYSIFKMRRTQGVSVSCHKYYSLCL